MREEAYRPDNTEANKEAELTGIDKVEQDIALKQKELELEAINAGFKTAQEYKRELDKLNINTQKLHKLEQELKDREISVASNEERNINKAEEIVRLGKEYHAKWEREDAERKQIIGAITKYVDELAQVVYNMHPQYLSRLAKGKLVTVINGMMQLLKIELVIDSNNEYVSINERDSKEDKRIVDTSGIDTNSDNTASNIRKARKACLDAYKWLQQETVYGLGFTRKAYSVLKSLDGMIVGKSDVEIYTNMNRIMINFGVYNRGLIKLVEAYQNDDKLKMDVTTIVNYICQVSSRIDRLCGVKVNQR